MNGKNKGLILFRRLIIWALYLLSGYVLYTNKGYFYSFLITFSRIVYPLSIFWLQIRIKKRSNFLSIESSMTTSQLWFNILPVLASLLTVILSISNLLLFTLDKLIKF